MNTAYNSIPFQFIHTLPRSVVFYVYNTDKKEVYINHCSRLKDKIGFISGVVSELQGEFDFFEVPDNSVYKLMHAEIQRKIFIDAGYKVVNQHSAFIRFSVDIRIDAHKDHVLVCLTTARGVREIVGVFKTITDAEEYKQKYYGSDWNGLPVYAINKHTSRYWARRVYKQGLHAGVGGIETESNVVTQV